jgi:hypothetical protein
MGATPAARSPGSHAGSHADASSGRSRLPRVAGMTVGAAMVGYGGWLLLERGGGALWSVGVWFGGGLVVHDLVLAPLAALLGGLVLRVAPPSARAPIQAALVISGCIVLATLPLLLGAGRDPTVPSQQPLPYGRNVLAVLALVWCAALVAALVSRAARPGGPTPGPRSRSPAPTRDRRLPSVARAQDRRAGRPASRRRRPANEGRPRAR